LKTRELPQRGTRKHKEIRGLEVFCTFLQITAGASDFVSAQPRPWTGLIGEAGFSQRP
jgi:hypothetical protein